jgi:uncharacterized protein (TIGR03382 family)
MRMRKRWAVPLVALLLAGPATATTLGLSLSWVNSQGGTSTWTRSQAGTPTGTGQEEAFVGQQVAGGWTLGWDVTADADPFVNGFFSIQNNSTITQTYSFTVTLPITPPVVPVSTIGGSIGVTVTDANGNGAATVGSVGTGFVFNAANDGTGTLQLLGPGFVLNAPFAGGTATASASAGLPGGTIASVAANGAISITHTFTLTPGDSVGLTSFYTVNAVPEAGTTALFGAGVLGLAALGRRRTR